MASRSDGVDTVVMRTLRAVLALAMSVLLASCVGSTATPTPSPIATTPAPAPATGPTASASPTASAVTRQLRPFERAVAVAIAPGDPQQVAPDRERVAFVGADGAMNVLEVATGQTKKVHSPQQGWHLELDPHGLRGQLLVFRETRTDGQRTDARIVRVDLRTGLATTLDDFSGPFLGGGETWQPRAPITNGTDVLWIRVDDSESPFLVSVAYIRDAGPRELLSTGRSAVWIDLEERGLGRILISTLISRDQVAELVYWSGGHPTPVATRPSGEGGPAVFVGDRMFWGIGPGIARPIERGALIEPFGRSQTLELGTAGQPCLWQGSTARHLMLECRFPGQIIFVDVRTAERIVTGFGRHAGAYAVAWLEGTQWWLGILAP